MNAAVMPSKWPMQLDVDGKVDKTGVRFIGKATRQLDGTWHCLADVGGALCIVEVSVSFGPDTGMKGEGTS